MRTQLRSLAAAAVFFSVCLTSAVVRGDEAKARVDESLSSLESWLGTGANRTGWDNYLNLKALHAELAKGAAADTAVVQGVVTQLGGSAAGLAMPRFAQLREALVEWSEELTLAKTPDLSQAVAAAESSFQPVTAPQVASAKAALVAAVAKLDRYLTPLGANGEAWRAYLRWETLAAQTKADTPDTEALASVYQQLTADQNGLELPVFADVATSLDAYLGIVTAQKEDSKAKFAEQLKNLAAELKELPGKYSEELAIAIGARLGWLDRLRQGIPLVRAVRSRYSRPNLFVSASARLVGAGIEQPVDEQTQVRDNILGTSISGTGHTVGQVKVRLVPSNDQAIVETVLTGKTLTRTVGYNGPATIHSNSTVDIAGRKRIVIDQDGLSGEPATGNASAKTNITGVSARCRLVQKIATKKAGQSKGEAERIGSNHAGARALRERVDSQATTQLGKAQADYLDKFRNPLVRRREFPSLLKFSTTEESLFVTALQANRNQLGAPDEVPTLEGSYDLVVRAHESLVNNLAAALLSGVTIKEAEMQKKVIELRGSLPDKLKSEQDRDPWSITFAQHRPVSIKIADNGFQVTVRGQRYTSGDREFRAMNVTADYKVEISGNGSKLVRQGDLQIVPPNFVPGKSRLSSQQITLRTLLERRFGKLFEPEIKSEGLELPGQWAKAGRLDLKQLKASGGWAVLAWVESGEPVKPKEDKVALAGD